MKNILTILLLFLSASVLSQVYQYDDFNRIIQADYGNVTIQYEYDALGNRKKRIVNTSTCIDVSALPNGEYLQSFEHGFGGWQQVETDDRNWTLYEGGTFSSGTGPVSASDGEQYIYTEGSFPNYYRWHQIISPCFDVSSVVFPVLTFDYHMFGPNIERLNVLMSTNGGSWTTVYTITNDQGNQWNKASVSINTGNNSNVRFLIQGLTGGSYQSDIAIDNIRVGWWDIPDLVCGNFSATISNNSIQFPQIEVLNQLQGASLPVTGHLFLSTDNNINALDYQIKTYSIPAIAGNGSYSTSLNVTSSDLAGIPNGTYYIGQWIDMTGQDPEQNDSNNTCYISSPLVIKGCSDPNAHNYDPTVNIEGDCETCSDGILNGDETGVDCGGALCSPCPGGCPNTLAINTDPVTPNSYEVQVKITSKGIIYPSSPVVYQAGEEIVLEPGFQSKLGSDFHAYIAPCTPAPIVEENDTTTVSRVIENQDSNSKKRSDVLYDTQQVQLVIHPNPSSSLVTIQYYLPSKQLVRLIITSSQGKVISETSQQKSLDGWNSLSLDVSKYSAGTYNISIQTNEGKISERLVVIK